MDVVAFAYQTLSTATLVTHILIVFLLVTFFLRNSKKEAAQMYDFFTENKLNFVFLSTLIATLGSLFFSEVAKFTPCILCWYQRIFMYPQVILSFLTIFRDEQKYIKPYLIALNIGGALIALYHNMLLWFPQLGEIVTCSAKGGPSCIKGYTFYYGYITIPLMALTVFVFNIVILTLYNEVKKKKKKLVN